MKDKHESIEISKAFLKPIIVLIIIGFIYLFIFKNFNIGIPCLFYQLTGYKCPGCGMTHALSEVWNGNFEKAWEYNALSITVLPAVAIYVLYRYIRENIQKKDGFCKWEYGLLGIFFVTVLLYGYIRNK